MKTRPLLTPYLSASRFHEVGSRPCAAKSAVPLSTFCSITCSELPIRYSI